LKRANSRRACGKRKAEEAVDSPAEDNQRQVKKSKKSDSVNKEVNSLDPIMLEPLHGHIFKFTRANGTRVLFNLESLLNYLLETGDFSDPETRIPFSDADLSRMDREVTFYDLVLILLSLTFILSRRPKLVLKKLLCWLRRGHRISMQRRNSRETRCWVLLQFFRNMLRLIRNFIVLRNAGLERCAGEVVSDILDIIENCEPDEAEMRLVMRGKGTLFLLLGYFIFLLSRQSSPTLQTSIAK